MRRHGLDSYRDCIGPKLKTFNNLINEVIKEREAHDTTMDFDVLEFMGR